MHLSSEIAEPWGESYHHLPVGDVMYYLSVPSWFGSDQGEAADAIEWLNKGMSENDWTWSGKSPIPREKRKGAHKGEVVCFDDYRTLHHLTGHDTFSEFLKIKEQDMSEAQGRGRRMPKFLKWRSFEA